jgi:transposase, IS5 family
MNQFEMICLDKMVLPTHRYRRFMKVWDFKEIDSLLKQAKSDNPHEGYGLTRIFRCLLLQFLEDLSDRELEVFLQENTSGKWFCGFLLNEDTPDHTVFSRARKKIGTDLLSKIFENLRDQLKAQGYMNEVFTFVDASHLIAKATLWEERDEALKQKYEKLNNEVLPKVAHDKQARIGCKGKNKFWYGYKKHISVDMQSGMINKVAITPANLTDAQGMKHVCPSQGAIYADKGYCTKPAKQAAARKGCHLAAIKKNNMKDKNADQDRWYSKMRAPYERVFSQDPKRVRYKGIAKNQFTAFMEAICFNLKRLLVLSSTSLEETIG